jgi:hypothetical protein
MQIHKLIGRRNKTDILWESQQYNVNLTLESEQSDFAEGNLISPK